MMDNETISNNEGNMYSLTIGFIRSLYCDFRNNRKINEKSLLVKNKIIVYFINNLKGKLNGYISGKIEKQEIYSFIEKISFSVIECLNETSESIKDDLIIRNSLLIRSCNSKEDIISYIISEVDKIMLSVSDEINSLLNLFNKTCLGLLLDKTKEIKKMLKMLHSRDIKGKKIASEEILRLNELNNELLFQIRHLVDLSNTFSNSSNGKVITQTKEYDIAIERYLSSLEDLAISLEISNLNIDLGLESEGTEIENLALESTDEKLLKAILLMKVNNYFKFLLDKNEFNNYSKKRDMKKSIRKILNKIIILKIKVHGFILDSIEDSYKNYLQNNPLNVDKINSAYSELMEFLNRLFFVERFDIGDSLSKKF